MIHWVVLILGFFMLVCLFSAFESFMIPANFRGNYYKAPSFLVDWTKASDVGVNYNHIRRRAFYIL